MSVMFNIKYSVSNVRKFILTIASDKSNLLVVSIYVKIKKTVSKLSTLGTNEYILEANLYDCDDNKVHKQFTIIIF